MEGRTGIEPVYHGWKPRIITSILTPHKWWEGRDSNPRTQGEQIYSLPALSILHTRPWWLRKSLTSSSAIEKPKPKQNRDDTIRTCDPLLPKQVLYQAEPHPGKPIPVSASIGKYIEKERDYYGRGSRNRTYARGFGDLRSTIKLFPHAI